MKNPHKDHRKRVKEEFRDFGMEHFPDHKALEMALFYVISRGDTNPLAHRLIERFGSLSGAIHAPYDLLLEVEGVGQETATYISFLNGLVKRYMIDAYSSHNVISSTEDAKEYMRYRFLSNTVEHVLLVCLGPGGKVVYSGSVAQGTPEKVELRPSVVVRTCLRANATQAILAHNHPGGLCNPSSRDLAATIQIHQELLRVDVELLDHIIVASDGVYSMQENGMFPTLG